MKFDLATSIIVAVVGVVAAFFLTNVLMPSIDSVNVKVLSGNTNYSPDDPSPEIFNFRAVNPTVEVYVGGQNSQEQGE